MLLLQSVLLPTSWTPMPSAELFVRLSPPLKPHAMLQLWIWTLSLMPLMQPAMLLVPLTLPLKLPVLPTPEPAR